MTGSTRPLHLAVIRLEHTGGPAGPRFAGRRIYEITAPIDGSGRLDGRGWNKVRRSCAVARVDAGADREAKPLVCHPNGDWGAGDGGVRFVSRTFRPGGAVTMREADGETRTFRVTSLRALAH